jgi:preprotein translocase subunit SecF
MQVFKKTNFDFIGMRYKAYIFSGLILGSGIVSLVMKGGPKLGIDFMGGNLIQLAFKKDIPMQDIRSVLSQVGYADAELQGITGRPSIIIRVPKGPSSVDSLAKDFQKDIQDKIPGSDPTIDRAEFVGPAVGRALADQAMSAIAWASILIIFYVGFRFKSTLWGVCSIVAVVHDVLSIVGIFSILHKEITVTVVAGILTLAGYSMNDTIVIYDRMRENLRLSRKEPLGDIINHSVNETLSRTIMTSMTVAITLLVLFFFGGEVIHDFAFAMLWGVFVGSYSSIFVAAPIIYQWQVKNKAVIVPQGRVPAKK